MKKVVLFASSNPIGNTWQVIRRCHPTTEIINLEDYKIDFFRYDQKYCDDFDDLFNRLMQYDHIVFASPIYWYSCCGQMKIFIDRLSDLLFGTKSRLNLLRSKSVSFLGTYAVSYNGALEQIEDTFKYLKVKLTDAKAIKFTEN